MSSIPRTTVPSTARRRAAPVFRALLVYASLVVPSMATPSLPAEEYALFSALLGHGLAPDTREAVIADTTTGDPSRVVDGTADAARATELGTRVELLREWARLNRQAYMLERRFTLRVPYELYAETDRELLFRGDNPDAGWKLFYSRYPGSEGVIRLSRAAFDGAQALVYLEFQCGPECGSGRLVQLSRDAAGAWQVDGGELIWIAGPAA
jgi:hypothetical protein